MWHWENRIVRKLAAKELNARNVKKKIRSLTCNQWCLCCAQPGSGNLWMEYHPKEHQEMLLVHLPLCDPWPHPDLVTLTFQTDNAGSHIQTHHLPRHWWNYYLCLGVVGNYLNSLYSKEICKKNNSGSNSTACKTVPKLVWSLIRGFIVIKIFDLVYVFVF